MSIYILYGPGGSGKSRFQIGLIEDELLQSNRNIVTNLAVDIPRLCEYMEETYPNQRVDVNGRLRILNEVETRTFWKHRGPMRYDLMSETFSLVDDDKGTNGVLYIIDEAGAAGFDAVGWNAGDGRGTTRGVECGWYLDQQRKFSDDVYASQNGKRPKGIAVPFRDKAHGFIRLKNGYLQQFGIFKGKGEFVADFYRNEPTGKDDEGYKSVTFKLDAAGIASCYRTQDGVGVRGNKADIGKRAKGIDIRWAIPGAVVLVGLICLGIPAVLAKYTAFGSKQIAKSSEKGLAQLTSVTPTPQPMSHGLQITQVPQGPQKSSVTVVGIVRRGNLINVLLSDGRTLTEGENYLRVERTYVVCDGTRYDYQRPAARGLDVQSGEKPKPEKAPAQEAQSLQAVYRGEAVEPVNSVPADLMRLGASTALTGQQNAGAMPQNGGKR